jgi:hypothetical protein
VWQPARSRGSSPGGYFVPNNLWLDCSRVTLRTGFLWGCPESSWLPAQPLSSPVLRSALDDAASCLRLRYPYSRAQTDVPSALSSPLHGVESQSRPWGTPLEEVLYVLSTRHQGGRTCTDKVVELSANIELTSISLLVAHFLLSPVSVERITRRYSARRAGSGD